MAAAETPLYFRLSWGARWRVALRAGWLMAVLAMLLPLHALWRAAGLRSPWARRFLGQAARASGARVTVVGTPLAARVFFVANHVSWTDICAIGGIIDTAFVAQDKIADWPMVGRLAKLNNTIFVSRTDRRTATDQVARLRTALMGPQPVTLFPEGTTTDGHRLLPFKSVLFEGLAPPPRPLRVQPVVLDFDAGGKALAWIGIEGAPANALRTLGRRGTFEVRVHFLEPFDPAACADRKAVAAEARRRIASVLATTVGHPIA